MLLVTTIHIDSGATLVILVIVTLERYEENKASELDEHVHSELGYDNADVDSLKAVVGLFI